MLIGLFFLLPLEGGEHVVNELPFPAWGFGVLALAVLLTLLQIVRSVGKSRPHSHGVNEQLAHRD